MDGDKLFTLIENSECMPKLPRDVSEILEIMKDPMLLDIDVLAGKVARCCRLNDLVLKTSTQVIIRSARKSRRSGKQWST